MSFMIAVNRFLSVALRDTNGAPVTAFRVTPVPRTNDLLRNHGLIFRKVTAGFALYYKTNPQITTPLVTPISQRVKFTFVLTSTEGDLGGVFQDLSGAQGTHVLLDNLDGTGALQTASGALSSGTEVGPADHVFAGPAVFPVRLDVSGGIPDALVAADRFTGAAEATATLNDPTAEPPIVPDPAAVEINATIDTQSSDGGALRLVTSPPSAFERVIYADDNIAAARPAAIIDLFWEAAQDAVPVGSGVEYDATFRLKS